MLWRRALLRDLWRREFGQHLFRALYYTMNPDIDAMPTGTEDEKRAYNKAILKKMLEITASPADINRNEKIRIIHDLYVKYIPEEDNTSLVKQVNAFQQKYNVEIMDYDMQNIFGPRVVERSYGTYRRWGGRKRARKTHKKKSKRRRSYSRNK